MVVCLCLVVLGSVCVLNRFSMCSVSVLGVVVLFFWLVSIGFM